MDTYDTWGGSWGSSWALYWTRTIPAVTELPGGGLPYRRKKRKKKPEEIKERLDLKVYLEDLYKRLYEPDIELPKEVIAEVKAVVAPKSRNLALPPPEKVDFYAVSARINAVEVLLKAYELASILEDDDEAMMLL